MYLSCSHRIQEDISFIYVLIILSLRTLGKVLSLVVILIYPSRYKNHMLLYTFHWFTWKESLFSFWVTFKSLRDYWHLTDCWIVRRIVKLKKGDTLKYNFYLWKSLKRGKKEMEAVTWPIFRGKENISKKAQEDSCWQIRTPASSHFYPQLYIRSMSTTLEQYRLLV